MIQAPSRREVLAVPRKRRVNVRCHVNVGHSEVGRRPVTVEGLAEGAVARQALPTIVGAASVMGNLNANGISPAQWGFRGNDANGNPIFDSMGLIKVMDSLGASSSGTPQNITSSTYTLLTGSAVTFSLVRATNVLILIVAAGFTVTNNGLIVDFIDGVIDPSIAFSAQWGVGGPLVTSPYQSFLNLPAGNHTIDVRGRLSAAAGTFTVQQYWLAVFRLGA